MNQKINLLHPETVVLLMGRPSEIISTSAAVLCRSGFGLREVSLINAVPSGWQNSDPDVYDADVACGVQAIGNYSRIARRLSNVLPGQTFTFKAKSRPQGVLRRVASPIPTDTRCHYKSTSDKANDGVATGDEFVYLTAGGPKAFFPERIRAYRWRNDLSQSQLAKKLSVSPRAIWQWEKGGVPHVLTQEAVLARLEDK